MTSYEDFQLKTYRLDVFWLHSRFLVKVEFAVFSFSFDAHEWQHLVTSKHIYHWHWNTFSVVISKIFGKKQNSIVTFQSGQLTEQPKTLEDPDRFDLKFYLNCPIRIEIITSSYIFILFLPWVGTLCLHNIFGIKCQLVVKTI